MPNVKPPSLALRVSIWWAADSRLGTVQCPLATVAFLRLSPLNERPNREGQEGDCAHKDHGDEDIATHVIHEADQRLHATQHEPRAAQAYEQRHPHRGFHDRSPGVS